MDSFVLADAIDYRGTRVVTRACLFRVRGRQGRSVSSVTVLPAEEGLPVWVQQWSPTPFRTRRRLFTKLSSDRYSNSSTNACYTFKIIW